MTEFMLYLMYGELQLLVCSNKSAILVGFVAPAAAQSAHRTCNVPGSLTLRFHPGRRISFPLQAESRFSMLPAEPWLNVSRDVRYSTILQCRASRIAVRLL